MDWPVGQCYIWKDHCGRSCLDRDGTSRGNHTVDRQENYTAEEYIYGITKRESQNIRASNPVQGLTNGHATQVLALASDASAAYDCRRILGGGTHLTPS